MTIFRSDSHACLPQIFRSILHGRMAEAKAFAKKWLTITARSRKKKARAWKSLLKIVTFQMLKQRNSLLSTLFWNFFKSKKSHSNHFILTVVLYANSLLFDSKVRNHCIIPGYMLKHSQRSELTYFIYLFFSFQNLMLLENLVFLVWPVKLFIWNVTSLCWLIILLIICRTHL